MKKAALGMVKTGAVLGVGASIGGTGAGGIGNMAASLPTAGTLIGASHTIKLLKKLGK